MTAVLDRQFTAFLVLDTAAGDLLFADFPFVDGVDVTGMVTACETTNLIRRVGTDRGDLYALTGEGRVLLDAMRGALS